MVLKGLMERGLSLGLSGVVNNQTKILNQRFLEAIAGIDNQSRLLNEKLLRIIEKQEQQLELQRSEIGLLHLLLTASSKADRLQVPPLADFLPDSGKSPFDAAVGRMPLLRAHKTYNTSHPKYDAALVRNFPGRILNADKPSSNVVYAKIKELALPGSTEVPDRTWNGVLARALEEARTVPHSEQVFERRDFIEKFLRGITEKYQAHYAAGSVNLDDALFLYWLVRHLNPRTRADRCVQRPVLGVHDSGAGQE